MSCNSELLDPLAVKVVGDSEPLVVLGVPAREVAKLPPAEKRDNCGGKSMSVSPFIGCVLVLFEVGGAD